MGGKLDMVARIQMVLAEKRTSLAVLRTGIVLLTLPMSIVALLITTSRLYDPLSNLMLIIPLFLFNTVLVGLGFTLIFRALSRIIKQDRLLEEIKRKTPDLQKYIP
ncbi:MAG TPA: hypothetical protein ENI92_03350 [Bacteroidetes bacterium]|nr:hypothetical protein [Bacteroidota bacterium]